MTPTELHLEFDIRLEDLKAFVRHVQQPARTWQASMNVAVALLIILGTIAIGQLNGFGALSVIIPIAAAGYATWIIRAARPSLLDQAVEDQAAQGDFARTLGPWKLTLTAHALMLEDPYIQRSGTCDRISAIERDGHAIYFLMEGQEGWLLPRQTIGGFPVPARAFASDREAKAFLKSALRISRSARHAARNRMLFLTISRNLFVSAVIAATLIGCWFLFS